MLLIASSPGLFTLNLVVMYVVSHDHGLFTKSGKTFPEAIGTYTNFVEDDEGADAISEIVAAWEVSQ